MRANQQVLKCEQEDHGRYFYVSLFYFSCEAKIQNRTSLCVYSCERVNFVRNIFKAIEATQWKESERSV